MIQEYSMGTRAGTIGGTLLGVVINISTGDVIKTAILAVVGAVVSFSTSVFLKWLVQRFKNKKVSE